MESKKQKLQGVLGGAELLVEDPQNPSHNFIHRVLERGKEFDKKSAQEIEKEFLADPADGEGIGPVYPLKGIPNLGHQLRATPLKFIRSFNFKLAEDPINYYREQLMLFVPWREKEALVWANATLEELKAIYTENEEKIKEARSEVSIRGLNPDEDEEDEKNTE